MPFVVLEIQPTPNPNAMKFVLDQPVSDQTFSFLSAEAAQSHPLAGKLFTVPGVAGVLLLGDFITINKLPGTKWSSISGKLKKIIETM